MLSDYYGDLFANHFSFLTDYYKNQSNAFKTAFESSILALESQHSLSLTEFVSSLSSVAFEDLTKHRIQIISSISEALKPYIIDSFQSSMASAIHPITELSSSISDAFHAELVESAVFSALDYYHPYMTEKHFEAVEEISPEILEDTKDPKEKRPRLTLDQLISLLGIIISILISLLPDPQLSSIIQQNEQIIAQQEEQIRQTSAQREEEISILADLSAASQEISDMLQRIADTLEDANAAADLVSEEPDALADADRQIREHGNPASHDGDINSHDEARDAQ